MFGGLSWFEHSFQFRMDNMNKPNTSLKPASRLFQFTVLISLLTVSFHSQAVSSLNLANYQWTDTYMLPRNTAREASAITYNWDTKTLFVLGDEGEYVVEISNTGSQLSVMSLSGFEDTEGLTNVGNGRFVVTEERQRNAYLFDYTPGGTINRSSMAFVDLGSPVGNIGIEGISFDPRDGTFITVKEKTPQEINRRIIDFDNGTVATTSIFNPNILGLLDLSDIQVLSTVPSLLGTPIENNLLILSQESSRLLEVDLSGNILSSFDLSRLSSSAEGVTITPNRTIYIVDENGTRPRLFVLTPVPLPAAAWLLGTGLIGLVGSSLARSRQMAK